MIAYLWFLLLTIVVEIVIVLFILRKKPLHLILYVILINCLTWPLAFIIFVMSSSTLYVITSGLGIEILINFFLIEIAVFIVEAVLIKLLIEIKFRRALFIAFVANIVTALMSFLF